jgi:hypothetical protein
MNAMSARLAREWWAKHGKKPRANTGQSRDAHHGAAEGLADA